MISNICKIEKGTRDLANILKECNKVAVYNQLNEKQTLQLRLICEELDAMLPNIINEFDGDFWIEFNDGQCKVIADITFEEFTADKKKELIAISLNKKNAFAKGIVGKIRSVIENLYLDKENVEALNMSVLFNSALEYSVGMENSYIWSLNNYKSSVVEENKEDWDELEKSIIAHLADDVIVGVKGTKATITVIKNFK